MRRNWTIFGLAFALPFFGCERANVTAMAPQPSSGKGDSPASSGNATCTEGATRACDASEIPSGATCADFTQQCIQMGTGEIPSFGWSSCTPAPSCSDMGDGGAGSPYDGSIVTGGAPCTLSSAGFVESDVLAAFEPQLGGAGDVIKVWYSDEHALTLGVREVVVNGVTTNYPVSAMSASPAAAQQDPAVGTTALIGNQAGTDAQGRPLWPALFLIDVTNDKNSTAGSWNSGGQAYPPSDVFGTWKAATKTVVGTTATIATDGDPKRIHGNRGSGDPAPNSTIGGEGFSAEIRWNTSTLPLEPGHTYHLQVIVHDGDHSGDAGQACITIVAAPPPM